MLIYITQLLIIFTYINYRNKLKSMNAQSLVQGVNSSWKCALVSQGIVCGNGSSVRVEGTIFLEELNIC
ncbi:MAG: hypothetical protein L6U99_09525 [Clostridium sp.]|nr:MAG: hypothetical protein L6U99_09525 [Clostridium sp.]